MQRWPIFDEDQIDAVAAVLRSGKVNSWTGPDVREFEDAYATYTRSKKAIALANGTVSLDIALRALGLEPGDEVIVTPRSYVASAACVLYAGGVPVFADVDADTQNITAETIAPLIGPRTKGIIPVHLAGWPCEMADIMSLAREHNLWVIEDCAQAHGAMIDGRHVGTFGEFGSFSFCQDKIITTGGEGGLLITDDQALWSAAWSVKEHGKNYDTVFNRQHPPGFRWLHESVGTNLRMTGLSAVLGRLQLARLDDWRQLRTQNAMVLANAFAGSEMLRVPLPGNRIVHAFYRFYCFVRPETLAPGWNRDRIMVEINNAGFPAFSGSCSEIYLEKVFVDRKLGPPTRLPVAQDLGETSLTFLVDPSWAPAEVADVAQCTLDVLKRAMA
jgi:dTDP-4-amino-4,6-dideoxygalactose transaminase